MTYRDGRTQAISADTFGSNGDYRLFTRNGVESLIAKKDVESVIAEAPNEVKLGFHLARAR